MEFVIGEAIKKKVEEKGITLKAFAAAIGMTPRNLDRFFERKDVTMQQLVKASEFLDYDFVTLYLKNAKKTEYKFLNEPNANYEKPFKHDITCQLTIHGPLEKLQKEFPSFISLLKREAEMRGLYLG